MLYYLTYQNFKSELIGIKVRDLLYYLNIMIVTKQYFYFLMQKDIWLFCYFMEFMFIQSHTGPSVFMKKYDAKTYCSFKTRDANRCKRKITNNL